MRDAPTKVNDDRHSSSAATAVNNKQTSIIDWNRVIGKNWDGDTRTQYRSSVKAKVPPDQATARWPRHAYPLVVRVCLAPNNNNNDSDHQKTEKAGHLLHVRLLFVSGQPVEEQLYHPIRYANTQRHLSTLRKCNNQLHHQYHDMAAVLSCGQNRRSAGRSLPTTFCLFVRSSLAALSLSRWVRCRWRWRVGPGLFFPCRLRRGTHQTVVHSSRAFFRRERRPVI
jgi:hypothetical protein